MEWDFDELMDGYVPVVSALDLLFWEEAVVFWWWRRRNWNAEWEREMSEESSGNGKLRHRLGRNCTIFFLLIFLIVLLSHLRVIVGWVYATSYAWTKPRETLGSDSTFFFFYLSCKINKFWYEIYRVCNLKEK